MYRKILVAIDQEAGMGEVVKQSISLAKAMGASIMFLRVLSPQDENAPFSPASDSIYDVDHSAKLKEYLQQWQSYEQTGVELLKNLTAKADAEGVTAEFSLNRGEPGRMICDLARNCKADLVMLAGREKQGPMGLILGSVSNYVTHHAPCSVLLVHE